MRILLMEKVVISSAYINLEASADYDENFRFCVERISKSNVGVVRVTGFRGVSGFRAGY